MMAVRFPLLCLNARSLWLQHLVPLPLCTESGRRGSWRSFLHASESSMDENQSKTCKPICRFLHVDACSWESRPAFKKSLKIWMQKIMPRWLNFFRHYWTSNLRWYFKLVVLLNVSFHNIAKSNTFRSPFVWKSSSKIQLKAASKSSFGFLFHSTIWVLGLHYNFFRENNEFIGYLCLRIWAVPTWSLCWACY